MDVLKRLLTYIKPNLRIFIPSILLLCIVNVLQMVNPYITGFVVDNIIIGSKREYLLPVCGIILLTAVLKSTAKYFQAYLSEMTSQKSILKLRHELYNHIQGMDFNFFDKTRTGELMSRMTGDLDAIRGFLAFVTPSLLECFVYFIAATIILIRTNFQLALIALSITPFICYFTFRLAKVIGPSFGEVRQQFAKLNSAASENITGVRVVRSFAQEGQEIDKFSRESGEYMNKNVISAGIWGRFLPILDFFSGVSTAALLLVGGTLVMKQKISLGTLVLFTGYMGMLIGPMRMLGWLVSDMQRAIASGEKIFQLLDLYPFIRNPESPYVPAKLTGHIEFRSVYFKYDEGYILEDISFDLRPGKTLAIMGTTGAGKSSIISLINRFYDASKGSILIDGTDIKKYDLQALREKISLVMQETFLFSDTVKENIAYGKPEATQEEVEEAARIADAHNFILEMPEQYQTIIGERGIGLSGGQKQRVSLARAILKDPSVLILDDATSAVDMETEHEIQKKLKSIFEDRTTIVIAHRISSVKNADEILVLDNGKIVERGTHESLLAKKGLYFNTYCEQYKDYESLQEIKEVV